MVGSISSEIDVTHLLRSTVLAPSLNINLIMNLLEVSVHGRLDQIARRYQMDLSEIVALNPSGYSVIPLHYSGEFLLVKDLGTDPGTDRRPPWATIDTQE